MTAIAYGALAGLVASALIVAVGLTAASWLIIAAASAVIVAEIVDSGRPGGR